MTTVAFVAALASAALAQSESEIRVPAPPEAGIDLSRMHYGSPAAAPPDFRVPLPPDAALSIRDGDLGAFSPIATAVRAELEKLPGASPAQQSQRRRPGPDRIRAHDIREFYVARGYAPVWLPDGRWTAAARSTLTRLQRAGEDGLDLGIALPAAVGPDASDPAAVAAAEIQLSRAVVRYAQYARGGRIVPRRVSPFIDIKLNIPEPDKILAKVSGAEFAGDALFAYNPAHPDYAALRAKLAEIRGNPQDIPPIAHGKTLRVGMRDARVPLIRLRFGLSAGAEADNATLYDTKVAGAVARFQRSRGLPANGRLTRATIAALSVNRRDRVANEIIANMERWRWLPQDLGKTHIVVNVPEYQVRMIRDGREIHSARVIVGKPETPTPVFSDVMETVVVNPYWHVPQSIIKKEMLPAYERNPDYFSRRGYEVERIGERLVVRQPPGPRNALGYVKLLFPNRHAVYMHDTPSRGLFSARQRAFSHGCVRVQDPFKLAGLVLEGQKGWSEQRLRRMIGGKERAVRMANKIPVHIVYFTTTVDETGELRLLPDIYGLSARLRRALQLRG